MATRLTDLRTVQRDYAALDDRMLVLDFQAGDPEAFVEIHHRYGGLARHVCRRFLPNRQDADEAFQETMVRVFQGLYRFNGRYALQPWIARIATNVSLDQLRSAARRPSLDDGTIEDAEPSDPADGPEELVERLVRRDLVLSVMAELPEKHRAALVLREIEGRSHREIAERLGMTPSQAKALIHRAKGSFRRGWLVAVTEKGGFAGVAVLPLLWLAKVGDLARRLVDRAGHATQVAQVATPEVVTATTSSPAVVTATASGIGERIVAAGVTLLVAGGVTVGAVTVKRNRAEPVAERAEPAVVQTVQPSPAVLVPAGPSPTVDRVERTRDRATQGEPVAVRPGAEDEVVEEPIASEGPATDPTPTGSPSPEPPPAPVILPAPAWSFSFTTSGASVESCGCDPAPELVSSSVEGTVGGDLSFAQVVRGAAYDSAGDPTWPFYLSWAGAVGPAGGHLGSEFMLSSVAGMYWYEGAAVVAAVTTNEDGSTTYRFRGTYELRPDQDPVAGIPVSGALSASVGVWADGTLFVGSFALHESPA